MSVYREDRRKRWIDNEIKTWTECCDRVICSYHKNTHAKKASFGLVTFDLRMRIWMVHDVLQAIYLDLLVPFFGYLRSGAPRGGQFHRDVHGDENICQWALFSALPAYVRKMNAYGRRRIVPVACLKIDQFQRAIYILEMLISIKRKIVRISRWSTTANNQTFLSSIFQFQACYKSLLLISIY